MYYFFIIYHIYAVSIYHILKYLFINYFFNVCIIWLLLIKSTACLLMSLLIVFYIKPLSIKYIIIYDNFVIKCIYNLSIIY